MNMNMNNELDRKDVPLFWDYVYAALLMILAFAPFGFLIYFLVMTNFGSG
jgi:membrane-bound metal-dependent hydrolase YbcI (DUF457 family)